MRECARVRACVRACVRVHNPNTKPDAGPSPFVVSIEVMGRGETVPVLETALVLEKTKASG